MITVYWANEEKTIIQLDYSNPIASWDEYRTAVNQSFELAQEIDHACFIIHNGRDAEMPSNAKVDAIEHLKKTCNDAPDNVSMIISVIAGGVEKRITNIVPKLMPLSDTLNIQLVSTLDEAYTLITNYQQQET